MRAPLIPMKGIEMVENVKPKRVRIQKSSIREIKKRYELRQDEVEVPEFNETMGLKDDETAVVVVRQLTLTEFLASRQDVTDYVRNLVEGVMEAASDMYDVKDEVTSALKKMNPETRHRVNIIEVGLVDPKLLRGDIILLSQMFPMAASKIYNKIMELTNKGADLKKNSQPS